MNGAQVKSKLLGFNSIFATGKWAMPDGDEISDEDEFPCLIFLAHPSWKLFLMSGPLNILCSPGQFSRTPFARILSFGALVLCKRATPRCPSDYGYGPVAAAQLQT